MLPKYFLLYNIIFTKIDYSAVSRARLGGKMGWRMRETKNRTIPMIINKPISFCIKDILCCLFISVSGFVGLLMGGIGAGSLVGFVGGLSVEGGSVGIVVGNEVTCGNVGNGAK
jgi:hypothetical protein